MNLSTELVIPVIETHANLAKEENRKWKISIRPKTTEWTMTDMKDTVSILRNNEFGFREDVYDEELDVHSEADATILRVSGIHNISNYCQYENPLSANGRWHRYTVVEDTNSTQLPDIFSLTLVSQVEEERLLEDKNGPTGWDSTLKNYKIVKRIVYTDTKTDVRYVVSMIKASAIPAQTMIQSGVSGMPPKIAYTIECPPEIPSKDVMVSIVRMMQIIEQNCTPMTVTQKDQILLSYDTLVDKVREKRYFKDRYYLAPKPLTLERIHLNEPGLVYGQLTVLNGYAVTDKADGERMLLYVDDAGVAYLINNAFEVRGTGWRVKRETLYNTLLDGEYLSVNKRLDGSDKDMFAAFDIYFVGGESVMGLPLVVTSAAEEVGTASPAPAVVTRVTRGRAARVAKGAEAPASPVGPKISGRSRVEVMNMVLSGALWEHERDATLELRAKTHIAANGSEMLAACRSILETAMKAGAPYDIDGLIFTPTDIPVLGYYPGKAVTIKSAGATWDRVLKWKPPQQNSIDFCVGIDKNNSSVTEIRTRRRYARLRISCGYSALKNEEISVSRGLKLLQTRISERNLVDEYGLKDFTPQYKYEQGIQYAYIPYENDGTIRAENGDEIRDGSIVEFSYDLNDRRSISYRWRAMRVRNDKMRTAVPLAPAQDAVSSAKKSRQQLKTIKANDWKTATSIWKSIHEPVTRDMICGVEIVPQLSQQAADLQARLLGTDAVYYGRSVTREHLLSVEMLNFHNTVIKDNLYKWPQQLAKNSLLELACGMAGDMNRWQDPATGFSFRNILGVDLVRDNITKAVDGAYARVLKPKYGAPRRHQNYVFVIGDCAKPLHTGAAAKGLDKDSEDTLLELYGKVSRRRLLTIIPPFAKDGFDMVSCQFAIHYFFETEDKLKGFLANVRDNLRPGGLFITTFMDGNSVEKLIREKGKNGLVEGRKLDGKVVVWAIRRVAQGHDDTDETPDDAAEHQAAEEAAAEPFEMIGGAPRRTTKVIEVYEPSEISANSVGTKRQLRLVNVPGMGDCMFISLELAAFGKERSKDKDGSWMRAEIVKKLRELLNRNDEDAKHLYEEMKIHIDNMSPDVREEASTEINNLALYSSDSDKGYTDALSGYLEWMSKKRVWGTEIELRMAVEVLERPVFIYQTNDETNRTVAHSIGLERFADRPPIRVWYNGRNHYKALLEIEPVPVPPTPAEPLVAQAPVPAAAVPAAAVPAEEPSKFGRLIDVYLENTNRLIPEYLVDFNLLSEYAGRYGLEIVHDGMFSDTYQANKVKNPNAFPEFDKDIVQQQFSFLNRWVVFQRKA